MIHLFKQSIAGIPLPEKFTYPFNYTPHQLCIMAANEVQQHLSCMEEWEEEAGTGKMFGVLVVQESDGTVGYLAAYSGTLAGRNDHPFFVPPIYDLLQKDGFFKQEEEEISRINRRVEELSAAPDYREARTALACLEQEALISLGEARNRMQDAKAVRRHRRLTPPLPSPEEEAAMIRESQHQKAEYKRLKRIWEERTDALRSTLSVYEDRLERLKHERKSRSAALQQRMFGEFRLLNARNEVKNLHEIFAGTVHGVPPAGAGECAAPKLLQQAYLHGWRPLAMAEFWWGASPKTEIRIEGHYYPACKGKCGPILAHMLQGLDVEEDPLSTRMADAGNMEPGIVYEDNCLLVICKPAGLLSVPGKYEGASVCNWMKRRCPEAEGPMVVHRLDMETSGLMLIAKTKEAHRKLQAQFAAGEVEKRYMALLDGKIETDSGRIELPICPDPMDRPRQMVHPAYGKPAITEYKVLGYDGEHTRIIFRPLTGRTHQLRVHAAHPLGLNCPITGDALYGRKADRLYLHALYLGFTHPATGRSMCFESEAGF